MTPRFTLHTSSLRFALPKLMLCVACLLASLSAARAADFKVNETLPAQANTTNLTASGTSVAIRLNSVGKLYGSVYTRIVLVDINTLQPLYEASKTCFSFNSNKSNLFQQTDYGLIQFPRYGYTRDRQNVTFKLPDGKQWTDVAVAVLYRSLSFSTTNDDRLYYREQEAAHETGIQGTTYTAKADGYTYSSSVMNIESDPTSFEGVYYYTFNYTNTSKTYLPYEGIVSSAGDFETNESGVKRQHAHKWEYTLYVKRTAGNTVQLKVPVDAGSGGGNSLEYGTYWRWYDNNTFRANAQLSKPSTSTPSLSELYKDENGESVGLMYVQTGSGAPKPTFNTLASTIYTLPDDVADWTGADIAVDCGRYCDWHDAPATWREPTISMRYIFHIRPAEEIAENIKASLKKGNVYEDNRSITIPLLQTGTDSQGNPTYSTNTYATLRLQVRSLGNYWFYPFTGYDYSKPALDSYFGSTMEKCQSVTWVVMTTINGKIYYHNVAARQYEENGWQQSDLKYAFHDLKYSEVLGTYTCVTDETDTYTLSNVETGRCYTLIVYANGFNADYYDAQTNTSYNSTTAHLHTSPLARFDVYFVSASEPQSDATLAEHRTLEHLESNYTRVGAVTFDDFKGMTYDAPTTVYKKGSATSNSYDGHLTWDNTYYGLVSPELASQNLQKLDWNAMKYAPFHGEYVLVKSAGLTNVSTNSEGYQWWSLGGHTLYDRTYVNSGGKRYGYFMYIDASDEARPIASLDFEANLCAGATLMFTANVADVTSASERPQLIFRLYGLKTDADGNVTSRNLIQSFASGDFSSFGVGGNAGVWYQVFAKTFVQPGLQADEYQHFSVSVENACKNTSGADYCIDDVRFYVANDQVEVLQTSSQTDVCEKKSNGAYLKFRMDYNMVKTFMDVTDRGKPIFYRICDEKGNPVETDYPEDDRHAVYTDAEGHKYASFFLSKNDAENTAYFENDVYGYRRLILAEAFFNLDPSKNYYISVALPVETFNGTGYYYSPDTWGAPSTPCSIYSKIVSIAYEDFAITSTNGSATGTYFAECGESTLDLNLSAKLSIPDAVYGGRKTIDWKFDWLFADPESFETTKAEVLPALQHFREAYPNDTIFDSTFDFDEDGNCVYGKGTCPMDVNGKKYTTVTSEENVNVDWKFSPDDWLYISAYSTNQQVEVGTSLWILNSNTFKRTIDVPSEGDIKINLYLIPVPGIYTDPKTGVVYHICTDALPSSVTLAHNSPKLDLGFPEVAYPDDWDGQAKNVRLGLHHLNDFKQGKLLRIPVHGFRDGKKNEAASRNNLSFEEDNGANQALASCVRLYYTNDPTLADKVQEVQNDYNVDGPKVGEVVNSLNGKPELSATDPYVVIDFSKNTEDVDYTGYDDDGNTTTTRKTYTNDFTFHEGYEYRFRLIYHDATDVIGDDVVCYGKTDLNFKVVPEYVTWTDNVAYNTNWNNDGNWRRSSKAELNKDTEGQNSDNYQDYGTDVADVQQEPGDDASTTPQTFVPMKFTKVTILPGTNAPLLGNFTYDQHEGIITTESLINPNLEKATDNINYDLMVTEDIASENGKEYYDVERFYGNTCKEVYFRNTTADATSTEGQLRNQHYLYYNQAWVDFALPADRWSIFSAPLHNVYAGDFYAPHATASQTTEAFQPINFGDGTGAYNRVKLPVYQRTWYDTDAKVVTADGNDYTANVPYSPDSTAVNYVLSEWSHAYNDVEQLYGAGEGFSLRPVPADEDLTWTLFRLPKADTTFDYYDRKGVKKDGKTGTPADRSLNGKLVTTLTTADDPQTLNGVIQISPSEAQRTQDYYLIGNPYMASLDMQRFLNDNVQLLQKYWTIENGELKAYGASELGQIAPLQAFFVKASTGTLLADVTFLPSQCTTSFSTARTTASADVPLTLTVEGQHGKSSAKVVLSPTATDDYSETEDVESIFDSNLITAPQIYTVSGQRAAAINRRASLRNVPFGVEAEDDSEVKFTLSGLAKLSAPLYLYDAKTDKTQLLTDSTAVTICTNAAGRYFLTSSIKEKDATATALRCYSVNPGHVVLATSAGDRLTNVDVYDMTGRFISSKELNATTHELLLSRGVYLITLTSEQVTEGRTFKIIVK